MNLSTPEIFWFINYFTLNYTAWHEVFYFINYILKQLSKEVILQKIHSCNFLHLNLNIDYLILKLILKRGDSSSAFALKLFYFLSPNINFLNTENVSRISALNAFQTLYWIRNSKGLSRHKHWILHKLNDFFSSCIT